MEFLRTKMTNKFDLSNEEISCLYRCISISMDWRDAVDEELVKEKCTRDWLTYNIQTALNATNKLSHKKHQYEYNHN